MTASGRRPIRARSTASSRAGMFVSFGNASGPITNFNLLALSQKGSLYATRPTLATPISTPREALLATAEPTCSTWCCSGVVKIAGRPDAIRLRDAAQAHRDLEGAADHGLHRAAAVI